MQWDHIRSFLAVTETGSLAAAARMLGVTQPTVGRHIDLLEQDLGTILFTRSRDGMAPTDAGAELVEQAEAMKLGADALQRRASGRDTSVAGTVRISVNDVLGIFVMPRLLTALAQAQPEITVELDITNSQANLLRRDADIAVRLAQPTQADLLARRITDLPMGLYAHRAYLSRAGVPGGPAELTHHRMIGFDREPILLDAAARIGLPLVIDDFQFRCDSIVAQIEMLKAGMGIAVTHQGLAALDEQLMQVLPDLALPPLPLWLTCHQDIRFNRRVRLVMDFLADALQAPYQWVAT